ncbi:hypothetical protein QEP15_25300 [Achromobacter mucicolens]|uniref:hypothetical protein n=1 Tax=Achromobacter TaxID=222 RepID=UPI00187B7ECB|nr:MULTISPECIES: hypothetical protein [Achromobacter]WGJ90594.1 hypothetical protein QEP15_25300 [Achromobacter mucicolens]
MRDNNLINAAARENGADAPVTPRGDYPREIFWGRLFCNWKTLAIAAVFGVACGVAAYFFVPKKWPAILIVRVGDVKAGHDLKPELLEQVSLTSEWMKSHEFVDAVVSSANAASPGQGGGASRDAKLFRESLTVRPIPGTQLLRVDYLGYSHHQLQVYVNAIEKQVRASHDKVMDARLEALIDLRNKYDGEVAAEGRKFESLGRKYNYVVRGDPDVSLWLAPQLRAEISQSELMIGILRRSIDELDDRIALAGHYSADVAQAEILVQPVFPRLRNLLPPAMLLGILCGFIFLVIRGKTRFVLLK